MAAGKFINENYKQILANWILTSVTLLAIFAIGAAMEGKAVTQADIDSKASVESLKEVKNELKEKADKEYVKEQIKQLEEKQEEIFEPIQKDLTAIKNFLFYNQLPAKN